MVRTTCADGIQKSAMFIASCFGPPFGEKDRLCSAYDGWQKQHTESVYHPFEFIYPIVIKGSGDTAYDQI